MTGEAGDLDLLAELERRFGPLRHIGSKPFSLHYRTLTDSVLVKLYRGIDPAARQAREVEALRTAGRFGVCVPRVLAQGHHRNLAWEAVVMLVGRPLTLRHADDVHIFATTARALLAPLHSEAVPGGPGHGWSGPAAPTTSVFLTSQFSDRFRALPACSRLGDRFRVLDDLPVVRLHGDVKPDHILVANDGAAALVDWEACVRGPSVLDHADITFRVVREVVYTGLSAPDSRLFPRCSEAHAAALSWRLALWLDRRHNTITDGAAAILDRVADLPLATEPVADAMGIVRVARTLGTEY